MCILYRMAYLGNVTFSRTIDNDTDPDYIYYNATIINNRTTLTTTGSGTASDPFLRFQETRDGPIIEDASKYHFSVVRFVMNGANKDLPLFIPVIRTGAANPTQDINLTIYSVSLELVVNNTTGVFPVNVSLTTTQPLIWITETLNTNIAPPPLASTTQTGQDIQTRYYWGYTYTHFIDIANTALKACVTDLQTQFDLAWANAGNVTPAPSLNIVAPFITWDPDDGLFTIHSDTSAFGGDNRTSLNTASDNNATLFFNGNMFGLFCNFKNIFVDIPGTEKINRIFTGPVGYSETTSGVPAARNVEEIGTKYFWNNIQDYESTSTLWSPIENIVFNSTLLPLVFEQSGDPVKFGESNVDTELTNSQSAIQPIITDIALPMTSADSYRSLIYYSPTAEYRMASFQRSKQPINTIDIQVFWRNRLDGQLNPVQLFNCSSVSLKIMFRRRGIYTYPHPAGAGVDV